MCGHVVRTFEGVLKKRIALRNQTLEKTFQVFEHFRVVILLNH